MASGNLIWDTAGLQAVVSDVASAGNSGGTLAITTTSTSFVALGGAGDTTSNFTIARANKVLILACGSMNPSNTNPVTFQACIKDVGSGLIIGHTVQSYVVASAAQSFPFMMYGVVSVPAGTYLGQFQFHANPGLTPAAGDLSSFQHDYFLIGG